MTHTNNSVQFDNSELKSFTLVVWTFKGIGGATCVTMYDQMGHSNV